MTDCVKDLVRKDFDDIAELPVRWNHNSHYHGYLLRFVPAAAGLALEIGCGQGEMSRKLASRCRKVTAIDLSPRMIERAMESSRGFPRIEYLVSDFDLFPLKDGAYDFIVTIATMHHLRCEDVFRRVKRALRPGGVFVVLDLYRQRSLGEYLLSAVAVPLNIVLMKLMTGRFRPTAEERSRWQAHGRLDSYITVDELRRAAQSELGPVKIRRHLFWRYSLVFRKAE